MTGNKKETGSLRLQKIVVDAVKLDASYSRGKEIKITDVGFTCLPQWKVTPLDDEWDVMTMNFVMQLYRLRDKFIIVKVGVTSTYNVSTNVSFAVKVNLLSTMYNATSAHIQGIWKLKIHNPCIAGLLPQTYDKLSDDEAAMHKSIYEGWE